jgi:DNA helicase-2/ATP-dependent DNA helicase PcrA
MIPICKKHAMAKKPRMGEIYQNYVDRCFKSGAMDFDDLLLKQMSY